MGTRDDSRPNRLIHEKSPYLLQHAWNPVDWYPWGEEAFEKARREDKPIFLSIGYSSCHWCHVMERESFADEEVAELLNEHFVSIKVDREERPDIDHIYLTVCQALTGQGGWPLTIIMTPEKKPFFASTYFPRERRFGRPGLLDILPEVAATWRTDRSGLLLVGERVCESVRRHFHNRPGDLSADVVDEAYRALEASFDAEYGGFGSAPKFPTPHVLVFLLRYWYATGNTRALAMARKTLECMRRGGIYDHVGFGFTRYSTDRKWLVPHFEKMLYDNALLAYAYLEAHQATGAPLYARVAREVFAYVEREMTAPEGAFYSAQDADSEGVEGKFYLWTPEEVRGVLGEEEGALFCEVYGIRPGGNFQGRSVPNLVDSPLETVAGVLGVTAGDLARRLEAGRARLLEARATRVPPHRDDKVLTAWNALMIAALAKGARVLGEEALAQRAVRALDFLWAHLRREDGRLLARYREGEAACPAYLDDYAFLVWGLLELYETTFDARFLRQAYDLTGQMLHLFWDDESGGMFLYGKDAEQLIARPKVLYDGAMPSGNSVAALSLVRLARLGGNEDLHRKAEAQMRAFAGEVSRDPAAHCFFLTAVQFAWGPTSEIVVVGRLGATDTEIMLRRARSAYLPLANLVFRPTGDEAAVIDSLVPFVRNMEAREGGKATAYVCQGYACQAPTTDPEEFAVQLRSPGNA